MNYDPISIEDEHTFQTLRVKTGNISGKERKKQMQKDEDYGNQENKD